MPRPFGRHRILGRHFTNCSDFLAFPLFDRRSRLRRCTCCFRPNSRSSNRCYFSFHFQLHSFQMGIRLQPAQMQSSGVGAISGGSLGHPELHRTRKLIRGRIFELLRQRHRQPISDASLIKLRDIARRLEEGLFKSARTKEEHMNLSTLEQRLHMMVQRLLHYWRNVSSSPSVGTMIPTPGTRVPPSP